MERTTKEHPDAQLVCLNGHLITSEYYWCPEERKDHCPIDGEPTIHACPKCEADIPGTYYWDAPAFRSQAAGRGPRKPNWSPVEPKEVPAHCARCGAPYPWTERRRELEDAAAGLPDALTKVELLCKQFHIVACQLQNRHDKRTPHVINDEYDVQDFYHALLRVFFDDVRPEEWTPSYAGKSSRMDFLLKREQIVVEVKKSRAGLGAGEVGSELIEDIRRYREHSDCRTLVCFVYDPEGLIANPRGLEHDLSGEEGNLSVVVIIAPRGH